MTPAAYLTGPFVSLAGRLGSARYCPGEAAIGNVFYASRTHGQPVGARSSWYAGAGRHVVLEGAAGAAAGEALERYALRDLDDTRVFSASVCELAAAGRAHVPPGVLAPVLDAVPNERGVRLGLPPADDQRTLWMRAHDLVTFDEVLVPAQYCIFLDHRTRHRPEHVEEPWCMAISNGTAAGPSPAAATVSGLLELLERDAFMLMWYHRLRFPVIQPEPGSRMARRLAGLFGRSRIDVRFIDLTEVHGVPVVTAAARGSVAGEPVYALGGGAAADLETAWWKAAREVAGLYAWARAEVAERGPEPLRPEEVATYGDHVAYYAHPSRHEALGFLFDDRPALPVRPRPHHEPEISLLRRLARQLRADGIDAYTVDLTPPGAENFGLYVHKVVSPQLIPLDYNHQARHLNRDRLLREPTRRGWRPDLPALAELNHAPHPFP